MTEKVLGFKEKDGTRARRHFDGKGMPAYWEILEERIVPVVSVKEHEKEIAKIKSEKIDKWLKKKGGLLEMPETIITAKVLLELIKKMPTEPVVSVEWLKDIVEDWIENLPYEVDKDRRNEIDFVDGYATALKDLLCAVEKEAGEKK
jgi:hypothetical protein